MKNTIFAILTLALTTILFSCQMKTDPAALEGYWQSTTDAKYQLKMENGQMISVYNGTLQSSEPYQFHAVGSAACKNQSDHPCITTETTNGVFCYAIMKADGEALEMYEVSSNGQPLAFKKTEPFDILPDEPETQYLNTMCYQGAAKTTDQFSLELTFKGDRVTGYLTYFMPDAHTAMGQLDGIVHGDVIIANYTHLIEGSKEVSEVAFRYEDGKVYEGRGVLVEKDGQLKFKDKDNLQYETLYTQVECDHIAEHIQWSKEAASEF